MDHWDANLERAVLVLRDNGANMIKDWQRHWTSAAMHTYCSSWEFISKLKTCNMLQRASKDISDELNRYLRELVIDRKPSGTTGKKMSQSATPPQNIQ